MMSGNKVMKTTLSFEQPLNSCLIEHTSALKQGDKRFINMIRYIPVSYTHLTLPTIYSV